MLTAVAIIPSAPVLIPELAGAAAAEVADLRDAVFSCVSALPDGWIAIGVGSSDQTIEPASAGTFAGYGADVRVSLSPETSPGTYDVRPLPLCALMTGWVRGQVQPDASAQLHCYPATLDQDAAVDRGNRLRTQIEQAGDPVGVLIVADGANTLTAAAPGGHDPDSPAVQAALDDALASGDTAALIGLPAGVVGRVAFWVLAGLAEALPLTATERYRGAPYGVGYFAGLWTP